MRLLIDGVFYQLASGGIARFWSSVVPRLASQADLDIVMLDRGNCPVIDNVTRVKFPSYTSTNTAADSLLIDRFCKELDIDVFTSTYYTTPISIPSVLVVYDMIPEILGFNLEARNWKEKEIAISFASYYACISNNTLSDLRKFHPEIGEERAVVAYCGVDRSIFRNRDAEDVRNFKANCGLSKPFFLLVGLRRQNMGYKNAEILFDSVRKDHSADFDILCVGGEDEIHPEFLEQLPPTVNVSRMELTDDELSLAYSSAEALVYPSLYEGFGMPIIEAMACGCPVITTPLGSIGEIAGEAACFVTGRDSDELLRALRKVREPVYRTTLIERGLQQVNNYDWDKTAKALCELFNKALVDSNTDSTRRFFTEWKRLRTIQGEVDLGLAS